VRLVLQTGLDFSPFIFPQGCRPLAWDAPSQNPASKKITASIQVAVLSNDVPAESEIRVRNGTGPDLSLRMALRSRGTKLTGKKMGRFGTYDPA